MVMMMAAMVVRHLLAVQRLRLRARQLPQRQRPARRVVLMTWMTTFRFRPEFLII